MMINLHGTGIDVTPSIKTYAEKKMSGLTKFFENIHQADIDLGIRASHAHKGKTFYCEATLHTPRKQVRIVEEGEDQYEAIDRVRDRLKIDLEKMKEKMRLRDKKILREAREYKSEG